jgi:hypothetical protein
MHRPLVSCTVAALLLACSGGEGGKAVDTGGGAGGDDAWRPDLVCPGDAGCASNAGPLEAGASARDITPTCFELWEDADGNGEWDRNDEAFYDCGCDQLCEGDDGWPGADEGEGDGEFQAVWMAGFGNSRPANGVHDPLWARTVVFRTGDTSVAVVSLDLVGWFYDDALSIRERAAELGADVDLVVVQASHQHEGPDTLGQWGQRVGKSGVDPAYQAFVIEEAAQSVADAAAAAVPATLHTGAIDTAAPFGSKGTWNTVRDSRDPVIIDEMLYTARFAAEDGTTIATMVNWGNHPEVLSSRNLLITSDYADALRRGVEDGVTWADGTSTPGLGGVCIYVNASVGGLMTPLGITVSSPDGDFSDASFEKSDALGYLIAELALQADAAGAPADEPLVSLRTQQLFLPVENYAFQAMFLIGVFDRAIYNYDESQDITEDNTPEVLTEIDLVRLGPIAMLTVPGELSPELAIGGYDGSHVGTDEVQLVDPGNSNPPDLAAAPEGPYLKDRMGGQQNWIIGLGNDELGYFIPPYDYVLHPDVPYLSEADGDHYEETNSLGPQAVPRILETAEAVIGWAP